MKKFTIPCNFGGTKAPFDVYIGDPKPGNHPLQNQAAWLSAERGGTIPPEVMESFSKLLDLSEKHKVSFQDLCVHAMKEVNKDKGAKAPTQTAAAATVAAPTAPMDTPGYVPKEQKAHETPVPEKIPAPTATHQQAAEQDKERREQTTVGKSMGGGGGGSSQPATQQPPAQAATPAPEANAPAQSAPASENNS